MSIDNLRAQLQSPAGGTPLINEKRKYQSPELVYYGSVSGLTQNASSGSTEGSSGTGVMMPNNSDIRLKQKIVRINNHPLGFGVYLFDYKPEFQELAGRGRQFGVMAQEVEAVMPAAVETYPDGYKRVHYEMLGIDLSGRRVF